MTLADLIRRFRTQANDKVEPYFWSDEEVTDWLNDGVQEACIRKRLLHTTGVDEAVVDVTKGKSFYQSDSFVLMENLGVLYEIDSIRFVHGSKVECLKLVSPEWVDRHLGCDWRDSRESCLPQYALQGDNAIQLAPAPDRDGKLVAGGYFIPKPMVEQEDTPLIHSIHHKHLINWALFKAFSIPDAEMFDPSRAAAAEFEFTRYFGIQPESDLRRLSQEDIPHANRLFNL